MRVELRDSQTQTQRYVSRFEHQALHPRLHNMKDFHYLYLGTSQRNNLYTRGGYKAKCNTLLPEYVLSCVFRFF